jgi:hypothetical protein
MPNPEFRTPNHVLSSRQISGAVSSEERLPWNRIAQRPRRNAEGRQNGDDFIGQSGLGGLGSSDPPGAPPKKATPGRITQRPLRNAEELRFGVRVPGSPHFDFWRPER